MALNRFLAVYKKSRLWNAPVSDEQKRVRCYVTAFESKSNNLSETGEKYSDSVFHSVGEKKREGMIED